MLNKLPLSQVLVFIYILTLSSCHSYHPLAKYNSNKGSEFVNDSLNIQIAFFGDNSFTPLSDLDRKELSKTLRKVDGLKSRDLLLAGESNISPLYKFYFFYKQETDEANEIPADSTVIVQLDSVNSNILLKKSVGSDVAYFLLKPKNTSTPLKSLINDAEQLTKKTERLSDGKTPLKYPDIFNTYKDSYNYLKTRDKIKNAPIAESEKNKWIKLQYLLTVNSFMAHNKQYDSLLNEFEYNRRKRIESRLESLINTTKNIRQDEKAVDHIVNLAKNTQVVMLNENHWYPKHRKFAAELLKPLKDIGYNYLALEALYNRKDSLINTTRPYPIFSSGYYVREPWYAHLIREAKALGFTLVSYDDFSANNREITQADNILNVLKKKENAKIFVYAGLAHIEEEPGKTGVRRMASYLKEKGNINPLTIDQTELVGNFASEILMFPSNMIAKDSLSKRQVDFFIINNYKTHPLDQFKGEELREYNIDLSQINYELVMISLYFRDEYTKFKSKSIPFYNLLAETKREKPYSIKLPKGNYILKIHSKTENNILHKEIIID